MSTLAGLDQGYDYTIDYSWAHCLTQWACCWWCWLCTMLGTSCANYCFYLPDLLGIHNPSMNQSSLLFRNSLIFILYPIFTHSVWLPLVTLLSGSSCQTHDWRIFRCNLMFFNVMSRYSLHMLFTCNFFLFLFHIFSAAFFESTKNFNPKI